MTYQRRPASSTKNRLIRLNPNVYTYLSRRHEFKNPPSSSTNDPSHEIDSTRSASDPLEPGPSKVRSVSREVDRTGPEPGNKKSVPLGPPSNTYPSCPNDVSSENPNQSMITDREGVPWRERAASLHRTRANEAVIRQDKTNKTAAKGGGAPRRRADAPLRIASHRIAPHRIQNGIDLFSLSPSLPFSNLQPSHRPM